MLRRAALALAVGALAASQTAWASASLPVPANAARFFMATWKRQTLHAVSESCAWEGSGTTTFRCVFRIPARYAGTTNGYDEGIAYAVTRKASCAYAIDKQMFVWGVAILSYDQTTYYHACFR